MPSQCFLEEYLYAWAFSSEPVEVKRGNITRMSQQQLGGLGQVAGLNNIPARVA